MFLLKSLILSCNVNSNKVLKKNQINNSSNNPNKTKYQNQGNFKDFINFFSLKYFFSSVYLFSKIGRVFQNKKSGAQDISNHTYFLALQLVDFEKGNYIQMKLYLLEEFQCLYNIVQDGRKYLNKKHKREDAEKESIHFPIALIFRFSYLVLVTKRLFFFFFYDFVFDLKLSIAMLNLILEPIYDFQYIGLKYHSKQHRASLGVIKSFNKEDRYGCYGLYFYYIPYYSLLFGISGLYTKKNRFFKFSIIKGSLSGVFLDYIDNSGGVLLLKNFKLSFIINFFDFFTINPLYKLIFSITFNKKFIIISLIINIFGFFIQIGLGKKNGAFEPFLVIGFSFLRDAYKLEKTVADTSKDLFQNNF